MILVPVLFVSVAFTITNAVAQNELENLVHVYGAETTMKQKPMMPIYEHLLEHSKNVLKDMLQFQNKTRRSHTRKKQRQRKRKRLRDEHSTYLLPSYDRYSTYCRNGAGLSTYMSTRCLRCKCSHKRAYQCIYNKDKYCKRHGGNGSTFRNDNGCLICRGQDQNKSICMRMRRCIRKPPSERRARDKIILDKFLNNLGNELTQEEIEANKESKEVDNNIDIEDNKDKEKDSNENTDDNPENEDDKGTEDKDKDSKKDDSENESDKGNNDNNDNKEKFPDEDNNDGNNNEERSIEKDDEGDHHHQHTTTTLCPCCPSQFETTTKRYKKPGPSSRRPCPFLTSTKPTHIDKINEKDYAKLGDFGGTIFFLVLSDLKVDPGLTQSVHDYDVFDVGCTESERIIHNLYPHEGRCSSMACWKHKWLYRGSEKNCPDAWCKDPELKFEVFLRHHNCFKCSCIPKINVLACEKRHHRDNWAKGGICSKTFTILDPNDLIPNDVMTTLFESK